MSDEGDGITSENDPHDIRVALGKLKKDGFNPAMLLIELCICALFSNATLERFFSHMKYIKSDLRSTLTKKPLIH